MTAARVRRQHPPITYGDPQHLAALAPRAPPCADPSRHARLRAPDRVDPL